MNRVTTRSHQIRNRRQASRARSMLPQPGREFVRSREWHNPLRHLTLSRAIALIETYPRGEFADLMWTLGAPYMGIETADADLSAILSRRCNALMEMDWNANPMTSERIDPKIAEIQAEAIHDMMDGIGNLYAAIEHFQIAINRGFAHCEIIEGPDGDPVELRPVDQWHVVRDGIYGPWRYNPEARQTQYSTLPGEFDMPADRFILREIRRPLGRIALIKYVRVNLSESDWGAFVERYGLPSGVVTMPPDVSPDQEAAFLAAAEDVASGGSGALPHGSDYTPNSSDKGSGATPFKEHLEYIQQKLVLVGTNGMLTMLTQSGSGTLAGSAHQETFDQLARGDARAVSEIINRQLVEPWLKKRFPGQPISAHWELAFREEVDSAQVIEDAATLKSAGHAIDPAELEEKTGYKLVDGGQLAAGSGHAEPDAAINPVQTRANAPEQNLPNIGAENADPALDGENDGLLRNRDSEGKSNPDEADANGQDPAPVSEFEKMLAGLLRGGQAAWTDVIAEAVADGSVVPGQESERIENRFDDTQPRAPKGSEIGGQWTAAASSQARRFTKRLEIIDKLAAKSQEVKIPEFVKDKQFGNAQRFTESLKSAGIPSQVKSTGGNEVAFTDERSPGIVFVNSSSGFWGDPETRLRQAFESGLTASPDIRHIALHEEVHRLGASLHSDGTHQGFSSAFDADVAARVSKIAAINANEFLAETISAAALGREFDSDVTELLEKLLNQEFRKVMNSSRGVAGSSSAEVIVNLLTRIAEAVSEGSEAGGQLAMGSGQKEEEEEKV